MVHPMTCTAIITSNINSTSQSLSQAYVLTVETRRVKPHLIKALGKAALALMHIPSMRVHSQRKSCQATSEKGARNSSSSSQAYPKHACSQSKKVVSSHISLSPMQSSEPHPHTHTPTHVPACSRGRRQRTVPPCAFLKAASGLLSSKRPSRG